MPMAPKMTPHNNVAMPICLVLPTLARLVANGCRHANPAPPGGWPGARFACSSAPNAIFTRAPHNSPMDINSDNPQHGFQFPGEFEITAMGPAGSHLDEQIPA